MMYISIQVVMILRIMVRDHFKKLWETFLQETHTKQLNESYNAVVDLIPTGVVIYDFVTRTIKFSNKAFKDQFSYGVEEKLKISFGLEGRLEEIMSEITEYDLDELMVQIKANCWETGDCSIKID